MTRFHYGFLSLALLGATAATAAEQVEVHVKGMVCSFCAQGIKKKFNHEDAVSSVDVNLDEKWVKVGLKDGATLADERVKALITDAGYQVESIVRR
jgi:mercuric ion binding protein